MKGGFLDRQRAEALMRAAGIDALVVLQPENFSYATGATPGVAALWRRAGAAIALGLDGLFCDFPGTAVAVRDALGEGEGARG